MKLRYLILALLFCAPSAFAQDWATAFITNRNSYPDPDYSGKIPAAGVTFVSADGFSTPPASITRVTDGNTCSNHPTDSYFLGYSAEHRIFNSDSTRLFVYSSRGNTLVFTFNPSTKAVAREPITNLPSSVYLTACQLSPTGLELKLGSAAMPAWSPTDANVLYGQTNTSNVILSKLDLTNPTTRALGWQTVKQLSTVTGLPATIVPSANDVGIDASGAYLLWAGIGTPNNNQGNWQYVVVCRVSDGLCRWLNVNATTANVGGDFGPTGDAVYTGTSGTSKIHNVRMGPAGDIVEITTSTSTIPNSTRLFWTWQGLGVDSTCTSLNPYRCNGHAAIGYSHLISDSGCSTAANCRSAWYATLGSYAGTELFSPAFSGVSGIDGYYSWANVDAADTVPFWGAWNTTTTTAYNSTGRTPLINELVRVDPATGAIHRIVNVGSSNADLNRRVRGGISSKDDRVVAFASDMAAANANLNRYDVFLVTPPDTSAPAPTISSVSPNNGTYLGGTAVTATGTNFVSGATLSFDGVIGTSCSVADAQHVTCNTIGHAAGAVNVTVTNPDAQNATLTNGYTFTGSAAPTIVSVAPSNGSFLGGTPVSIVGTNFAQGLAVTVAVGGLACVNITVPSTTQIYCITQPSITIGARDVVVRNPDGGTATAPNAFTYTNVIVTGVPSPH